jgi:hypothetical protein
MYLRTEHSNLTSVDKPQQGQLTLFGNDEQVMSTNLIEENYEGNHDGEQCDDRAFCGFLESWFGWPKDLFEVDNEE